MPKIVTPAREAALTRVAKAAAAYHNADIVVRERHEQMIQAELLAIRTELAKSMVAALEIGTADAKIKDRSGIKDFYKRREMYDLGRMAIGATADAEDIAEAKRASGAEAKKFTDHSGDEVTFTMMREEYPAIFEEAALGEQESSIRVKFTFTQWGFNVFPIDGQERNTADFAVYNKAPIKKEIEAWASQNQ